MDSGLPQRAIQIYLAFFTSLLCAITAGESKKQLRIISNVIKYFPEYNRSTVREELEVSKYVIVF